MASPAAARTGPLVGTLAGVILLRVLGVSLLLAGFVDHGRALGGSTFATGLAFAAYPLALALFMLPLASLSDRVGRRPVMLGALAVSAVGGLAAAFAPTVETLALARLVQGAGAVNGVALALAGEVGDPARRTQRMALIGAAAGIGFVLGLILGAWLEPALGIPGLLVLHSLLTLALLPPIASFVPSHEPPAETTKPTAAAWWDPRVAGLGVAGFAVNLSLTGLLFLSPLLLRDAAPGLPYGLALTLMALPGGLGMFVTSRLADRGHARAVGVLGGALLALSPLPFLGEPGAVLLVLAGIVYFVGHSALSSLLPSLTSALAQEGRRGHAQGIQSTLQYVGSAVGASVAAALYPHALPLAALFLAAGALVSLVVARAGRSTVGSLS